MQIFMALIATWLAAGTQGPAEPASYAQTSSAVAQAIHTGQDLSKVSALPALTDAEKAELRKLAGCRTKVRPGVTKNLVELDWHCEALEGSGMSRTTSMRFRDDGTMFTFSVNPRVEDFAPTRLAVESRDLPGLRAIARRFGDAVRTRKDPTLGGLIPLTDLQRAQLEAAPTKQVSVFHRNDRLALLVWQVKREPGEGDLSANLHFDEHGRPIGATIEESLMRIVITREEW